MQQYKVKIKNSDKAETIKADSELEAKVKFCDKQGFLYRAYAGSIEALLKNKDKEIIKKR